MIRVLILLTSVFMSLSAQAQLSAVRDMSEDWMTAAERELSQVSSPMFASASAYSASLPYFEANWDDMIPVADKTLIDAAFYHVRDVRYLRNRHGDDFLRRITWLFPDDGCYARAALMKSQLDLTSIPVSRIFIFGDLEAMTPNHPSGKVVWWYHTAPIMKTPTGEVYVLDPAVEPTQPLLVKDWVLRQVPSLDLAAISICDGTTYGPGNACSGGADPSSMALSDISRILDMEWNRQLQLRREPTVVLGDNPPWIQ